MFPQRLIDHQDLLIAEREERPEIRLVFIERERVRDLVEPFPHIRLGDVGAHFQETPHQRRPEVVRRIDLKARARPLVRGDAGFVGNPDQFGLQPRFADAGLSLNTDGDLVLIEDRFECLLEDSNLLFAADEFVLPKNFIPVVPFGLQRAELIDRDGGRFPLHHHPEGTLGDGDAADKLECFARQVHLPARGDLHKSCREIDGIADDRIIHAQVASDIPGDHHAGMKPNVETETGGKLDRRRIIEPLDIGDQLEGAPGGPLRVIFMGQRCSEDRHDAVTDELVDRPLVLQDARDKIAEAVVQDGRNQFDIHLLRKGSKAGDIRKEDGNVAAFAFDLLAGLEDLAGELGRNVILDEGVAVNDGTGGQGRAG